MCGLQNGGVFYHGHVRVIHILYYIRVIETNKTTITRNIVS
jgi:hypothetical protein